MFCTDISWLLGFVASTLAAVCFLNRDVCICNIDTSSTIFGEFLYFCALANYTSRYSRNYNCSEFVPLPQASSKANMRFPNPKMIISLPYQPELIWEAGQETHLQTNPKPPWHDTFRTSLNSRIRRKWSSRKPANLFRHGPLKRVLERYCASILGPASSPTWSSESWSFFGMGSWSWNMWGKKHSKHCYIYILYIAYIYGIALHKQYLTYVICI